MDTKHSSVLEPRLSLSSTHLPHPIAESTCINIKESCTSSFRWGGSPMNVKNHNSNVNISNAQSELCNVTRNSSLLQRSKVNISKIDPRMYIDVQSKGLASRIVKYHERGSNLHRSMSMNNIYNKPGQFPIVNLKKTELPYRAIKQNVSMTRIPPPETSAFHGRTVSSLLRSNSIIGLHKTGDEISCENRPIMHPPATENDLAPTRSVLEVLKEISRKRINNEDLTNNESMKKYCNRDSADIADVSATISEKNSSTTYSGKRQREQMNNQQYIQKTQAINTTQNSPEQIAKKRMCTYNNDIRSSLSSSLVHSNKKRYNDQKTDGTKRELIKEASPKESYESQQAKIHRMQTNLRFEELSKTLSCNKPITPIPPTPFNQNVSNLNTAKGILSAPAQRTISEPVFYSNGKIANASKNKPKLTLFNKNCEDNENEINKLDDESTINLEFASIQFIKPKKSVSTITSKNPLIERTQKSKLALMLSGLRGELYQGSEDETDTVPSKDQYKLQSPSLNNLPNVEAQKEDVLATNKVLNTTTTNSNISLNSDSDSNSKTLDSGNVATTSSTTATTATTITTTTSTISEGFKFTPPSTSVLSTSTTVVNSLKKANPLTGIKLTPPQTMTTVGTSNAPFTLPSVTLTATSTQPTIASSVATTVLSVPSFTSDTAIKLNANPITIPTTTTAGGFAFNSNLQKSTLNTLAVATTVDTASTTSANSKSIGGFPTTTVSNSNFNFMAPGTNTAIIPQNTTLSSTIPMFKPPTSTNATIENAPKPFTFGSATELNHLSTKAAVNNALPVSGLPTSNAFSNNINPTTISFGTLSNNKGPNIVSPLTTSTTTNNTTGPIANTNAFSFGSASNKPAATATLFSKTTNEGISNVSNDTPLFGNPPNLTTATSKNVAAPTAISFGMQNANNQNIGNSMNNNTSFTFGTQPTSTNLVFGSNVTNANSTSGNNNVGLNTLAATTFNANGSANNQPTQTSSLFGGNDTNTNGTKLFSFGNVTSANSAGIFTSTFGNNGGVESTTSKPKTALIAPTSTSMPAVNVVKPNSTFGGNTSSNNIEYKPLFGSTNKNPSSINTFVAPTSSNINQNATSFSFGSNTSNVSPSNNIFGSKNNETANNANITTSSNIFGGNNTKTTNHIVSNNLFGAPNTNTNTTASSFSFSSNAGIGQSKPTTAFTFGGSGGAMNNDTANTSQLQTNVVAPFSFNGVANNDNKASTKTAFTFGNNTTNSATGNNLFSAPATNTNAQSVSGFNFTAAAPGINASTTQLPSTTNNIFASNVANPNERPIRRATRRLQK
ncbi:nuclear pore complex protein DDB_G0274915 [Teleopsis dalmanni]|uniref:nuclear pore complex protein DDB_G0274915 n=1 Tax=Teleopsis dalmanni TaxID=139649 RepID=UPI0018CDC759|nr:nuclear pore complex protein DDB_G0274915 [Teleopsis dalmanni]